ncbi:hypothetical protein IFT48_00685 [Pseudomonas fluorescens]|uniref:hypothetical protein n=1 Tax=Pseudomonas fluorescens TaxID=294 RepID=UPI001930973F|nr:hypothetical protein [Pseudomonas fluorescens]MBD8088507.1 hypothetical protein [Pseudomonas fluorescens]
MRLLKNLPLSTSDFTSGRFDCLCNFVKENWVYDKKISFEDSRENVAITLGYLNYAEAIESATEAFPECFLDDGGYLMWDPTSNLSKVIFGESARTIDSLEHALDLSDKNKVAFEFFKSWPNHLVSRWKYGSTNCLLSEKVLAEIEDSFDSYWCNNSLQHYNFQTLEKSTASAATIAASMGGWVTIEQIRNSEIKDFLDPEIIDNLFQDALIQTIEYILGQSWTEVLKSFKGTGFSPNDANELSRNEKGFPNLSSHMRNFLNTVILPRKALSLFTYERGDNGFYRNTRAINPSKTPAKDYYKLGGHNFVFQSFSDDCEPSSFRSHSWTGQIQSDSGDIIAYAQGSYISGPAKKPSSGGELISAADSVGDQDVDILDYVLVQLQNEIMSEYGEHIDKQDINMERLFCDGNIVTLAIFERNPASTPGLGMELVSECLSRLKSKYKRNFHVASTINPLQYLRDSTLSGAVTDERISDSLKIQERLNSLRSHPNVKNLFFNIYDFKIGIKTAFKYMWGDAE